MKILQAFNFWGLSDRNPTVVDFIADNNFEITDSFIGEKEYSNPNYSVSLIFKSVNLFKYYYHIPDEIFTDSIEEGFFIGLNVGDFYGNPNFPFELPFNMTFNDSYDVVKRKLKVRSTKITRLEKSVYCEFNLDKYSILTYFNFNDELIYLKFSLYEKSGLIKKQLEKSFKLQDKNIQNENISILDTVIIDKPTKVWKVRMLRATQFLMMIT